MEMKTIMQKAFNEQMGKENESAYIYLALSAQCEAMDLKGMAKWLRVQGDEELEHAMKFYTHLADRNAKIAFEKIDKPKAAPNTPLGVFEAAYEHEKYITKCIHELVDLANKHNDPEALSFLDWFVNEQIEEEKSTRDIVKKLEMAKGNISALLMLDKMLGERKGD
ncbi:ferritin [Candidatus Micrarchaeota archaeon CG10_big_fil_rev_8_21_14_0_10_45_29]|nr:MAG: ferritin [Candidatus Micrarchaeota archaeon CG10_big_fil_rev_8_21_14_0_10_45_29]